MPTSPPTVPFRAARSMIRCPGVRSRGAAWLYTAARRGLIASLSSAIWDAGNCVIPIYSCRLVTVAD